MESNESDLEYLYRREIFDAEFISYFDYLETIMGFLESERGKHAQSIQEINQKIAAGQIRAPADEYQLPSEFEYDYFRLASIDAFENTLFSSFFVMIYFYLESELTRHCRDLQKESNEKLSLTDIVGNGVQRAITYLVKVHHIDFSLGSSQEWEKIQTYNALRNCLVHNQGRIDEGFDQTQRERLLHFINKPNSKLQVQNTWCILNKEFCLEALETIKSFLHSVVLAKTKAQ
jgi:hypothetical protein